MRYSEVLSHLSSTFAKTKILKEILRIIIAGIINLFFSEGMKKVFMERKDNTVNEFLLTIERIQYFCYLLLLYVCCLYF